MMEARERRHRRSGERSEALRFLLETVRSQNAITSIAVINSKGLVVVGAGSERELAILGAVAEPIASGCVTPACEQLTEGTDILARSLAGGLYLAALGDKVSRMHEVSSAVRRILAA